MTEQQPKKLISNSTYDVLKWVSFLFLPAAGTLYFALAMIWDLPYREEVVGTVVALELFLGTILGVSNHRYNSTDARFDGTMNVEDTGPHSELFNLELFDDISELANKNEIIFKVNHD